MKLPRFKVLTSIALISAMLMSSVPVSAPIFAAEPPEPPAAWGAVPDEGQLAYHKEELSAFIHFGMNTFTGKEWGTGTETPAQFTLDPAKLDTDQWVKTLQDAGFKRLIFVAKHHDGFLNWYSELSDHSVESAANPVDVFAELSKSCTKYDMDMGVYLSPWDANADSYGATDPDTGEIDPWVYNEFYTGLLEEILDPADKTYGNDGKFVEVWMDGARGAGYYQPYFFDKDFLKQAKNLKTTNPELITSSYKTYPSYIDTLELEDDDTWFGVIKKHNPDMVIFSPVGSELRWPATEAGKLVMPVWSKIDAFKQRALYIANGESESGTAEGQLAMGNPAGLDWSIPEADTSITASGWFENSSTTESGNKAVKTMQQLGDTYFESVGRGGVLLLNFPPNVNGKLSQKQVDRVTEFGKAIKDTFAANLAEGAAAAASSYRGSHEKYAAANVLDGDYDTYWTMEDGQTTGSITIDLGGNKTFDIVSVQEYIPLGQRVSQYKVEVYSNGSWKQFGKASQQATIGHKALVRGGVVMASQVRITILNAQAVPVINEIGLFRSAHTAFEVTATTEFTPTASMKMIDERDPSLKYTGSWTKETITGAFENTHTYSSRAAANMITATFTGDSFSVVGMSDANHSKMDVFIDGVKSGVADFSGARATRHLAYRSPALENGTHEIKLITTESNKAGSIDAIFYTDNQDKPFYYIEKNSYTESKFSGSASFNVYRTGKIDEASSVKVSTAQDNAIAGRHFVHIDETLNFAPGETKKTVSVNLLSSEGFSSLNFYLRLDPDGDGAAYLDENYSVAKVTITDDPAEALSLKGTFADPGRRYGVIGVNQTVPGDLAAVRAMNESSFTASAWKGDTVSAQILLSTDGLDGVTNIEMTAGELTSGSGTISGVKTSPLRSVRASTGRATPNQNIETVPDIMAPSTPEIGDMAAHSVLPVWVSVDIPRDAAPGTYTGTITVTADELAAPQSFDLSIEVLDLVQPEPSDNEFYLDLWQYPYTSARYYGVEPWSDAHFEYLKEQAAAYRDAGGTTITATIAHNPWGQAPTGQTQQTYDVYPGMVKWTRTSGTGTTAQFEFDYTVFDQWIEFNIENGIDQQIDCYGILPWGSRNQFYDTNGALVSETFGSGDARWAHYWNQMLDSFINHLDEKGWLDIAFIATDERAIADMERVVDLVKSKEAPDGSVLKISSALNYGLTNDTTGVLDKIDHVSLNIDEVEDSFAAFVADRKAKGLNTTVYTCTGNYPNSFTRSQPAESAWMMYYSQKFGANGFLRWAFDAWTMEPLWSTDHWYWESGDCFQFYPAAYGETAPQSSPGFEMLKQGVRDVEKANYLKQADPSLAGAINALFGGIEKYAEGTHYVATGGLKNGTAAGNDKMVNDVNNIHDSLILLSKTHLSSDSDITLNKTEVTLTVDATEPLIASVVPYGSAVTWKTSNPAVASVDNNGLVTALAKGSAVITATIDGDIATCVVTVLSK
ncbi:MAG: DUF6067 family protein, partial [Clostridiales bacterium]|nr:DUF6067 family protein [Clostridiales bacterium]